MIIEIADPGFQWGLMWSLFGVGAITFIAGVTLGVWGDSTGNKVLENFGVTLCGLGVAGGLFAGMLAPALTYDYQYAEARTAAIEEAGFEHVDLFGEKFTASLDGAYYEGALVSLGDGRFQVVEIKR